MTHSLKNLIYFTLGHYRTPQYKCLKQAVLWCLPVNLGSQNFLSSQWDRSASSGTLPEVGTPTRKVGGTLVTLSLKSKMAAQCINGAKAAPETIIGTETSHWFTVSLAGFLSVCFYVHFWFWKCLNGNTENSTTISQKSFHAWGRWICWRTDKG